MKKKIIYFITSLILTANLYAQQENEKKAFSGIYPHLAYYNNEGECGTGAVVPWQGKLYLATYGPHCAYGSSDKLYIIDKDLNIETFKDSVGGTPANRIIHPESQKLFIASYVIDKDSKIEAISPEKMQGRLTASARHLFDPENKVYHATMEEGIYEVDVNTLEVKTIFKDNNSKARVNPNPQLLDGAHGKGLYSGQGVLVYANNGETAAGGRNVFPVTQDAGILAEWDGKNWKTIRRNQFTDITSKDGIEPTKDSVNNPIWSIGWDYKSILLACRDNGKWHFYRLPKSSHSYDGGHGWNTEWPRIRNIGKDGEDNYLMTMHGMFWKFPKEFSSTNTAGIRPRSAYLKVIGDFANWNDKIVFGCDDSAKKEFLNKRRIKAMLPSAGQSNSNIWFLNEADIDNIGNKTAIASFLVNENIKANTPSDPMLFAGWNKRVLFLDNNNNSASTVTIEIDKDGTGNWQVLESVELSAKETKMHQFSPDTKGEWIRIKTSIDGEFSAQVAYKDEDNRDNSPSEIFDGIANIKDDTFSGAYLYSLGDNKRELGVLAFDFKNDKQNEIGYYQLDANAKLYKAEDKESESFMQEKMKIVMDRIKVEKSSILIQDEYKRRWRLPLSPDANAQRFTKMLNEGKSRLCREVATERDVFHAHGTFYELPAENADGFAKIRPVSSHNLAIHDFTSYRGLLVLSGICLDKAKDNDEHIVISDDKKAAVWLGSIDDLWKLGKLRGIGGPLYKEDIKANVASDPYLIGYYEDRELEIKNESNEDITIRAEVNVLGAGKWLEYKSFEVKANSSLKYTFPEDFEARWIRFVSDKDANGITTELKYGKF